MYTVDASVWVNAFDQREVGYADSRQFLQLLHTRQIQIAVPTLLLVEVAGTISRTRGDAGQAIAFAKALITLPHVTLYDLDNIAANQSFTLAANQKLRGADAVYAALALHVSSTLVTLDKEQLSRLTGVVTTIAPIDAVAQLTSSQK